MQIKQVQVKKQQRYQQKLRAIDQHYIRTSRIQTTNVDFQDILRIIALKLLSQPPIEMFPFTPKTIIFNQPQPKRLFVNELTVSQDKKFILFVNIHAPVKISISVDQEKGKVYYLSSSKAIQLIYSSWKKLNIIVEIEKIGMFSEVRLHLSQIKSTRISPKKIGVNLRPKIEHQLEDYLKKTRGKTADILRQRSLTRVKQNLARRSTSSLKETKRSVQLIRNRSQLLKFEKQKEFYIKHVQKMSPERINLLKNEKLSYNGLKTTQIKNFAKLIYIMKFGFHIKNKTLEIHRKRFKNIKIQMLCFQFIKLLKNKLRVKITEKTRLRMNILHNMKLVPQMIKPEALKKAKKIIMESLAPYMEFRGLQDIAGNSQDYLNGLIKIQRFMRHKAHNYRERMTIISDKFCEKLKIDIPMKSKQTVVQKYLKVCLTQKTSKFYQNKDVLVQLLRENAD